MTGRTAIVLGVGSCSGLGAAVARRFAREGLGMIVAGRMEERLDAVASKINEAGAMVQPVAANVTREADVVRLFRIATSEGGCPELVVYDVGNNAMVPLLQVSPGFFESI
ncbi:MAG: SDR family NAD(P)-dependent oxidoreductase [Gammaproteobacteria bacterium]